MTSHCNGNQSKTKTKTNKKLKKLVLAKLLMSKDKITDIIYIYVNSHE